jgi:hypothetical protein
LDVKTVLLSLARSALRLQNTPFGSNFATQSFCSPERRARPTGLRAPALTQSQVGSGAPTWGLRPLELRSASSRRYALTELRSASPFLAPTGQTDLRSARAYGPRSELRSSPPNFRVAKARRVSKAILAQPSAEHGEPELRSGSRSETAGFLSLPFELPPVRLLFRKRANCALAKPTADRSGVGNFCVAKVRRSIGKKKV